MTAPGAKRVPRVAALGDSCADVYPRLGVRYPTGNAVDVAVHLRRLGVPVAPGSGQVLVGCARTREGLVGRAGRS